MTARDRNWVLLLDSNAPWVRSLFSVLPGVRENEREVVAFRVLTPAFWPGLARKLRLADLVELGAPGEIAGHAPGFTECSILVPGWTRFPRLSTSLVSRRIHRALRRRGPPEAIIYTLPQYAGVAEKFCAHRQAYYAFDPFRFYGGWDALRIDALEQRMLELTSVAFAISLQLVEDLKARSRKPVFYSPNAVSREFIEELSGSVLPVPPDLTGICGKAVGCTGALDPVAYDWNLVETLSARFPEATFVFVGGLLGTNGPDRERVRAILHRSNLRWVGRKPHHELPYYLRRFDVCLNPLAVNEHNQRRSPLRLYDYLATNNPILSTALREAMAHGNHVHTGRDADELSAALQRMLNGTVHVDLAARREYVRQNTWDFRAARLWERLLASRAVPAGGEPY